MSKINHGTRFFLSLLAVSVLFGFAPAKPVPTPSPTPRPTHTPNYPTINFNHSKHINEVGLDCDTCHTPGPSNIPGMIKPQFPDMGVCGMCHEEVEGDMDSPGCFMCHTDKEYKIVRSGDYQRIRLDRFQFQHVAHGERGVTCTDCHININQSTSSRDNNYPEHKAACAVCHGSPRQNIGCNKCHGYDGPK